MHIAVSDAATHDSQGLETLTGKDDAGQKLYADAAYAGQEKKASDRNESKAGARAEHIFGYMTNSMNGMHIKAIGILRAAAKIGL